jgi:hypothetical protein
MSEQKPSFEVKGIVRRAQRQDSVEAQIWGRFPKNVCSTEGPQEHRGRIIPKWKKFETTKNLPRTVRPAKLNNRGRRAFVREVTKNPMVTLTELLSEQGRTFQKDNHLCSTPIRPLWYDKSHYSVKGT